MKYVGLDLSTTCTGYSVFDEGKRIESGKITPQPSMAVMARIVYVCNAAIKVIRAHQPDKVMIEDTYYQRNAEVYKVLCRLGGAVYYAILNEKSDMFVEYITATRARAAFGLLKNTKDKRLIVKYVNSKFGLDLKKSDNDEADAIVTGYAGFYFAHHPDDLYRESEKKFNKTRVVGLRTKPLKRGKKRGS